MIQVISRPRADHESRHHVVRLRVDNRNAVARFGGDVDPSPIGTDRNTFRLDTHDHGRHDLARFGVDNRGGAAVFVRNEQPAAVSADRGSVVAIRQCVVRAHASRGIQETVVNEHVADSIAVVEFGVVVGGRERDEASIGTDCEPTQIG